MTGTTWDEPVVDPSDGAADAVVQTEVDGVRTLWAAAEGPLRAKLTFRTGLVDETLVGSGRTHLVEHLALFGSDGPGSHHNGFVDLTTTAFHTVGTPDEVVAFLAHVTAALRRLPVERLPEEKAVLQAEAEQRTAWLGEPLLVWRFGAAGPGLSGLPAHGVRTATAEQVQAWADARFTRENAVLILTGPPPAGLRLPLASGRLFPTPSLTSLPPRTPAWFCEDLGGVAASALLPRTAASTVLAGLAEQLLRTRLRVELALSYAPQVAYQRLDGEQAHLLLFADGTAEHRARLAEEFIRTVPLLAAPEPDAVARLVEVTATEYRRRWSRRDDALTAELEGRADDLLHARSHQVPAQLLADLLAVTTADVAAVADTFVRGALYALPEPVTDETVVGSRVPPSLPEPVTGKEFRHLDERVSVGRAVVGPQGLTWWLNGRVAGTVRFDRLAAALTRPDGAVTLIGHDATHLLIEPTLWADGGALRDAVLQQVPAELVVPLPERPAAQIPQPPVPPVSPGRTPSRLHSVAELVLIGLGLLVVLGCVGLLVTLVAPAALAPLSGVCGGALVVWVRRLAARRRARRPS